MRAVLAPRLGQCLQLDVGGVASFGPTPVADDDLLGRVEALYLVLFGWIAVAGPGAISVETILARRRPLPRERS